MTRSNERFKTTSALSFGLAAVYYGSGKKVSREMYMWDDVCYAEKDGGIAEKLGFFLSTVLLVTYVRMYVLHNDNKTMRFWNEEAEM